MKKLRLSSTLDVPVDICTEAVAWIGARGSGKTHGAGKLVELMLEAGVPVVILDPVGVWYGLRLAKDGKGQGLKIPVFGGLHGDIPLEPTAGALIADLICDKNLSAVLDVSQFDTDAQTARFVADFSERLFRRKKMDPSVICVVFDEGQEFLPQNPQPGEQMMLHRLIRQIKIGRNFGMGAFILSPRPQEINKKALNGCQTVMAFRLTGAHERKAMKDWIAAHDLDQSVIEKLPSLETGNCHVWSPAFLKVNQEIRILPKDTYDASATPKFGERRATRALTPIDLVQLREAMAATIDKAKAEDPKALQAKIVELQKKLYGAETKQPAAVPKVQRVEVPVLTKSELKQVEQLIHKTTTLAERLTKEASALHASARYIGGHLAEAFPPPRQFVKAPGLPAQELPPKSYALERVGHVTAPPKTLRREYVVPDDGNAIGPTHRRILNSLARLEQLGVLPASRVQVAVYSGVTPQGGYYARVVGELKTAGLVIYPDNGALELTAQGRQLAAPGQAPQTTDQLHGDLLARLGASHRRVMECLLRHYPKPCGRPEVAEACQMDGGGGYYARLVGELKTLGVVEYPSKGYLSAAEILFLGESAH
ncbi:MAG: hypothetical protein PHS14_00455 [Elusimicrobia bacterium]|nr:hypothetical protein [Elusimicrobiota bacterium]